MPSVVTTFCEVFTVNYPRFLEVIEMTKTNEELYQERTKRLVEAIQLRQPDRVPISLNFAYFPAKCTDAIARDAFYDFPKWREANKKVILEYEPDMFRHSYNESGAMLEALDYKQMVWPGHGVSPNGSHQYIEGEYMLENEYDDILEDHSDYLIRTYLPRIYGALSPLKTLPPLWSALLGGVPPNAVAAPEFTSLFEMLLKASHEAQQWRAAVSAFLAEMRQLGFPSRGELRALTPFDIVSGSLRGMKGSMLDMYRQPQKLLQLCDKLMVLQTKRLIKAPRSKDFSLVYIPLHRGSDTFMSPKAFETFYWPYVLKMTTDLVQAGLTPYLFFEGDCTSRLKHLLDLPKGKVLAHFDSSDIVKVKDMLRGHTCIMGNVPSSILQVGSPEEVKDYCRKLIDIAAQDGGFILSPRGSIDEAKPENLRAMVDFTREYGKYS